MRLPWPLGPRHRYEVSTLGERMEWALTPLVCRVVGHRPEQKMSCTICRRCRIVLREG